MKGKGMIVGLLLVSLAYFAISVAGYYRERQEPVGYTDTPMLPGGKWHVHDSRRPQPRVVSPGTFSSQQSPGAPPSDAVVLFDGSGLADWRTANGGTPRWKVQNGELEVPPQGTPDGGDIWTRREFGDCQLHAEWATPNPPSGDIMNRGNSGVFFLGLYELQVFDSFHGGIYPDGQAGAIYGQYPPLVNASRKPGEWQVFDVLFNAPRFKDGSLETAAYMTVFHNGVAVHNHVELMGTTGHRILPKYAVQAERGPIMLQAHGNPVRYRNIWLRPLRGYDEP